MTFKTILLVASASLALGACGAEEEFNYTPSDDSADTRAIAVTTMQYEGSCEFLMGCSVFSGNGQVNWGCGGSDCDAETRYVAAPSSFAGMCGEEITICLRGTDNCTTAEIKDMSCCNRWEAGPAVLRDLGVSFGETIESCSGFGEAQVSIFRGTDVGGGVPQGNGEFNGTFCTDPGGACGGNEPCWAECPAGSVCDFAEGDWGFCVE